MLAPLATRALTPEVMDDPDLDAARHRHALDGLSRLNRWSRAANATWRAIRTLARSTDKRPLRLLDIATGAGDAPRAYARFADRDGLDLHCAGCDISHTALAHARQFAKRDGQSIEFFEADALAEVPQGYDILTCSLFLHHLTHDQIASLLRAMAGAANVGFVVSDLRRTTLGFTLAWLASRVLTRSDVVHVDAIKSVRAALTTREIERLAAALTPEVRIQRQFPQRFLLTWSAPRVA